MLNGISSVEKFSFFSVDVADVGSTAGCAHETWIVGEDISFGEESADVDQRGAKGASEDGKFYFFVAYFEDGFLIGRRGFFGSDESKIVSLHFNKEL